MRTTSIKPGDIVKCDIRGDQFYAKVDRKEPDIMVAPLTRASWKRLVTSRQITEHYSKRKG